MLETARAAPHSGNVDKYQKALEQTIELSKLSDHEAGILLTSYVSNKMEWRWFGQYFCPETCLIALAPQVNDWALSQWANQVLRDCREPGVTVVTASSGECISQIPHDSKWWLNHMRSRGFSQNCPSQCHSNYCLKLNFLPIFHRVRQWWLLTHMISYAFLRTLLFMGKL